MSVEDDLDVTHEHLAAARKQIGELQKGLAEAQQLNAELVKERDEWRTKTNWYLTEKERLERLLSGATQELNSRHAHVNRLLEDLNLAQTQLHKLSLEPNKANGLLRYIDDVSANLPGTDTLLAKVHTMLQRNKELEQELDKLIKANASWQKTAQELTEERKVYELKLEAAAHVVEAARERLVDRSDVGKTVFLATRVAWHLGNGCDTPTLARELALAEWRSGVLGEVST